MLETPPRSVKLLSNLTSESRFCSISCSLYDLLWIKPNYNFGTDAAFITPKYFFNGRPWKLGTSLQGTAENISQFHSQALEDLQVERQSKALSVNLSMSINRYVLLFSCFWHLCMGENGIKTDQDHRIVDGSIWMRWIPFVSSQDQVSEATKSHLWKCLGYVRLSWV